MGVVYRARDIRLDRTVALKFLTSDTTHEPEARERFIREARTAAKTEHPNVCGIYDIGETAEGRQFIAMPFYEGVNLSDRLGEGPVPIAEAVGIARQVASGLASVHVHGIVHRDIKPGNILITGDGLAKILDFGLAKTSDGRTVTEVGMTVGTFAYMSPEQIRGATLDPRTDIWSLGVMLYELVCGVRPFAADYPEAVMYAVLNEEPPELDSSVDHAPSDLDAIIRRCLQKDPADRYQSAKDLDADLAALEQSVAPAASRQRASVRRSSKLSWPVVGIAAGLCIALLVLAMLLRDDSSDDPPPVRFVMMLPSGHTIARPGPSLTISRDGTRLAFAASDSEGTSIFVRDLDSFDARELIGTDGGTVPFFSPDGRWVGYMANDRLYKVSVDGGLPYELAEAAGSGPVMKGSATWAADGRIIFGTIGGFDRSLFAVSEEGGPVERITEAENPVTVLHSWPDLLPSGDYLLYSELSENLGSNIVVRSLRDGAVRTLVEHGTRPSFVKPNVLVYAVGSDLYAATIDVDRAVLLGAPVPVLHNVVSAEQSLAEYAVSDDGAIIYAAQGAEQFEARLALTSFSGSLDPISLSLDSRSTVTPRASPDGRFIAFQNRAPDKVSLWIHDLERGITRQLTDDKEQDWWYTWTPDSRRVIFNSTLNAGPTGTVNMFEIPVDGSGQPRLISDGAGHQIPHAVTPDGSALIYNEVVDGRQMDIFARYLEEEEVVPVVASDEDDFHPSISPDGRWLAFASSRSGRWEVYVQPFPGPGGVMQISSGGGAEPVWSPDGRALYYRDPDGDEVFEVPVAARAIETAEPGLDLGRPRFLLEGPFWACSKWGRSYDVMPDGKQFVVVTSDWPGAERHRFNVVVNWSTEVHQLLAAVN
jgi:serine/threonine-protein kinase